MEHPPAVEQEYKYLEMDRPRLNHSVNLCKSVSKKTESVSLSELGVFHFCFAVA